MAKGSQTGWFGLPPEKRFCAYEPCGERLVLSRDLIWHAESVGMAFHMCCWSLWLMPIPVSTTEISAWSSRWWVRTVTEPPGRLY